VKLPYLGAIAGPIGMTASGCILAKQLVTCSRLQPINRWNLPTNHYSVQRSVQGKRKRGQTLPHDELMKKWKKTPYESAFVPRWRLE
jgi:hypothetical protein